MHKIAVGELYNPNRIKYPEGTEFNFANGIYQLNFYMANPRVEEIQAIKKGEAKFKILFENDILFLIVSFGKLPWSDAPYHWAILPEKLKTSPEQIAEGMGIALETILVDAETGIVRAIRVNGLPNKLSREIVKAIEQQIANPIDRQDYSHRIDAIYGRYPTTEAMFKKAERG